MYPVIDSSELILTFDNDGVLIIDKLEGKLMESFSCHEIDTRASLSIYSETHNSLIFYLLTIFMNV